MAVTTPTPVDPAPSVPDSSIDEPTFDSQFEAFLTWLDEDAQPGFNALAENVFDNATEAETAAGAAETKADEASDSADAAALSEAAAEDARDLAQTYAAAAGAAAGVPALAGQADKSLHVKTDESGVEWRASSTPGPRNWYVSQHTASGTFVVPAGVTTIRPYAFGAGAAGTTTNSGGGGGCAYGDIAVTPGSSVTLSIVAGVAKVTYGGVDLLTANPASGVTAGTASKHASVSNAGAYPGGAGAATSGGASSGSPLGAGVSGSGTGGSGWGGVGGNGGGGGVGGPAVNLPTHFLSGPGLALPSTDPLLDGLTGVSVLPGLNNGQAGDPGAGGGAGNGYTTSQTGIGGPGGFGGGGGQGSGNGNGNGVGGPGGFGGGGGRGFGSTGTNNTGGGGGFGGGGGQGTNFGGAGGAAVIRIYY